MNILELFAGSRSIGKIADQRNHNVFSVDINDFNGINLVKDIEFLNVNDIPFKPDMIWASPPCTTYSIAAISHHRNHQQPKTDFAAKSDRLILNTINIIKHFDCVFYIENPVGMLRKMDFMQQFHRTTVTYCSYGDIRMKPTDIWSNNIASLFNPDGWKPIPKCYNNNKFCHHQSAPRGSRTGTQGLKNKYESSKIPPALCLEIIQATEKFINFVI
jgi:site-specific DNA-cytosine methylase